MQMQFSWMAPPIAGHFAGAQAALAAQSSSRKVSPVAGLTETTLRVAI